MGTQCVLFEDRFFRDQFHAQYALTPDDRRFIFKRFVDTGIEEAAAPPANMILIQHWLAELDLGRPVGR